MTTIAASRSRPRATIRLATIRTTKDRVDPPQPSVRDVMLAAVPSLRAFAISLSGNVDRADDLVQDTLLRAMANIDSFTARTNPAAQPTGIRGIPQGARDAAAGPARSAHSRRGGRLLP